MVTQTRPAPEFVTADGKFSVEYWASMPETKPYYELIEGELKRKMPTKQQHARAAFRLALQLAIWGDDQGWTFQTEGLGLRADDFNGFVPDVMGFAPDTVPDGEAVYTPSAFLIAEVLSPVTAGRDREAKKLGYARAEVELYLIVDAAAKTIEVYRLSGNAYGAPELLSGNDVWEPGELVGLKLDLSKIWM